MIDYAEEYPVMTGRQRAGVLWRISWPPLTATFLLVAFGSLAGARWPESWYVTPARPSPEQLAILEAAPSSTTWLDFMIFYGIATFLVFKSTAMARNMTGRDWIATSLIATNLGFASLYLLVDGGFLFPVWTATHPVEIAVVQWGLRVMIVSSTAAAGVLIALNVERDRVRWPWIHERLAPGLTAGAFLLMVVSLEAR